MQAKTLQQQSSQDKDRIVQAQPGLAGQRIPGPQGIPGSLLSLQRSHGNRFVQRLLDTTVLQRACGSGGTCTECAEDEQKEEADRPTLQRRSSALPSFIQAKLTVSQPGDQYEQEADRVAEEVMRMPSVDISQNEAAFINLPAISRYTAQRSIQHVGRQTDEEQQQDTDAGQPSIDDLLSFKEIPGTSHEIGPNLEAQIMAVRGGGQPLSPDLRTFFEPRFGVDFSRVRIHTDSCAAETVQRVSARAYTLGEDIAFAPDEYQENTPEGRRLLAHELTHVVQQGNQVRTLMRACDCNARGGRVASSSEHAFLSGYFPNLKPGDYCVTAPASPTYNCIAWSIGDTSKWIWDEVDSVYGNKNGTVEISDFDAFYKANGGLTPVTGSTPSTAKVALYSNGSTPTHAARMTGSGNCAFESKLGKYLRIAHDVTQLEGGSTYGNIDRFYV